MTWISAGAFFAFLIILFTTFLAICIAYFKWRFGYWKQKGVKFPPPIIPFGNAKNIFLQKAGFGDHLKEVYKTYKSQGLSYCGFYFFTKPTLVILNPDLIRLIMTKDFQHFTDHGNYVNEEIDPLSGHLFSLKGLKWKNLRAKLTPTFTSGKMKMMFQTLVDCSTELVVIMDQSSKEGSPVDIKDIVGRFTTDVIGSCAFGIECNSLRNPESEFRQYGKKVFEGTFTGGIKIFLGLCFPAVLDLLKIPITRQDVTNFFMNVVKETVNYRVCQNICRKDFMQLLIQLRENKKLTEDEDNNDCNNESTEKSTKIGESLTISELAAQAFIFFSAGFETSSTTLTFCFYELLKKPHVQNKLREEIDHVLQKYDGKITYDGLLEMSYMDMCINETLRKYPPIPALTRECTKEYTISDTGLKIEKGAILFIPILGIQNDSEYYPNPEEFNPERFSTENKSKRHPFVWLPFGEGPRNCIGLRFGMMQTKVALTVLLRNYRFTLDPKTKVPLSLDPKSFILTAKEVIWVTTEKILR